MKSNLCPEDKDKAGAYLIHNPETREGYIGSGILNERHYEHTRRLEKGQHKNYKLQMAYNRNPNFEFTGIPVEEHTTLEENRLEALRLEQSLIDEQADNPLLLNIAMNVEKPTLGVKQDPEVVRRRADLRIGTKHTDEAKEKIGRASKEMWKDESLRADQAQRLKDQYAEGRRVAPWTGKTQSSEHAAKGAKSRMKQVIVDGVVYDSVQLAAAAFDIAHNTAHGRLNNPAFPNWQYA